MDTPWPILEFDSTTDAMIGPERVIRKRDVPERCVMCFFQDVIETLCLSGKAHQVAELRSEIGVNPVYEIAVNGERMAVLHPGVGAPLAAAFLEEAIALGCRKFIACGGAGVLASEIAMGHVVVPSAAVRDEGTSYHYLPPSREVEADPQGLEAIETVLRRHGVDYLVGKTWTTDAIYRETRERVQRRRAEGCLTVEMEAATFFAVAKFRGVPVAQILYGGDDLGGTEWDHRDWISSTNREKVFWLAAEACLGL
jgi:uridine phosphorylase